MGMIRALKHLYFSSVNCKKPISHQSERSFQWQVRPAKLDDVAGVADILADSFHSREGVLGWLYPILRLGIYEDIRNRLYSASPHHVCLVAVGMAAKTTPVNDSYTINTALAGTVEITVRSMPFGSGNPYTDLCRSSHRYPYLSNLAVHSQHRRQGVAAQLLLNCEQVALSWGFRDLYLHVLENNYQARQLYFKLGYQLDRADNSWSGLLLKRPRQLLLHKRLNLTEAL